MHPSPIAHRVPSLRVARALILIGLLALSVVGFGALSSAGATGSSAARPTVVLVHGSFADASGFNSVIRQLQRLGYPTIAPPNPLRGLATDAAYIRSVLTAIDGPIVLVAHSYGGMVITNAATGMANVKALVYINGFAPAQGESANELDAKFPGSMVTPENLIVRPY